MDATNAVPAASISQSVWYDDYSAYRAPDGRWWAYTDDPQSEHVSWRSGDGRPVSVPVWVAAPDAD